MAMVENSLRVVAEKVESSLLEAEAKVVSN